MPRRERHSAGHQEGIEGVLLKGVEKDYDFTRLDGFLKSGRWLHFPDSGYSNEVDISSYTAKQLKLHTGDKALIYFIQPGGTPPGAASVHCGDL